MLESQFQLSISEELCTGCGECITVCREHAIEIVDEKAIIDLNKCIGCEDCVKVCPKGAIMMREAMLLQFGME